MFSLVSVDDAFICSLKDTNDVTVLLGSGVSIWKPSELPSGQALSLGVFRALFCKAGESIPENSPKSKIQSIVLGIPFEVIMEKCPDSNKVVSIIRELYDVWRPNSIHKEFACALSSGRIRAIITTNYDCCIDQCFIETNSEGRQVTRILREEDFIEGDRRGIYFKIHGSAEEDNADTLIVRLRQEGRLPRWKRILLKQLLQGSILLVVGYSGLDFDICPELAGMGTIRILWNYLHRNHITTNAKRVLEKVSGCVVIEGDMRRLINRIFDMKLTCELANGIDVEGVFRSRFSKEEMLLWQTRLLNVVACSATALPVLEGAVKESSSDMHQLFLNEIGQALFHRGKYKQAARIFKQTARMVSASENASKKEAGKLLVSAADSLRCSGRFFSARRCIRQAVSLDNELPDMELACRIAIVKLALLNNLNQIAKGLGIIKLQTWVQRKALSEIGDLPRHFLEMGAWDELQHLRLWADRLRLPAETVTADGGVGPPNPREGYFHLGQAVSQMMVFRDEAESEGLRDISLAEQLIEMAEFLGSLPESWKMRYLVLRKHRPSRTANNFAKFLSRFMKCEYTLWMRIYLIAFRK